MYALLPPLEQEAEEDQCHNPRSFLPSLERGIEKKKGCSPCHIHFFLSSDTCTFKVCDSCRCLQHRASIDDDACCCWRSLNHTLMALGPRAFGAVCCWLRGFFPLSLLTLKKGFMSCGSNIHSRLTPCFRGRSKIAMRFSRVPGNGEILMTRGQIFSVASFLGKCRALTV